MKLHERIKSLRESRGVSQTFMAKKMGISTSSYNMKERGNRKFSIEDLESISKILNVPIANFFEKEFHVKCNSVELESEVV